MDRSTTLQRAGLVIFISIVVALFYFHVDLAQYKDPATQKAYLAIIISSLSLFFFLEKLPLAKIYFDYKNDRVWYYRFLLFKKELSLSSILSAEGQTKTERQYDGKGRSRTIYITDVFLVTDVKDYQIRVFERAKINEFKKKFSDAKNLLSVQQ